MFKFTSTVAAALGTSLAASAAQAGLPYPVMFVTQVPTSSFQHVASTFGAHQGDPERTPRGGDLWIRYKDGTLRNLTKEAGYGVDGAQDSTNAIAVRQPSIHWNGKKAVFAMLVGAPTQRYQVTNFKWQLYEITGFNKNQVPVITKLACQPTDYNNIAPFYDSSGKILYVSDRPRSGNANHYPLRDEYESAPIDSGIWKLDPVNCIYTLLEHAPSGVTYPSVDSYGRVIFTKWDHQLRDQQADADSFDNGSYGSFNYDSEDQSTPPATHSRQEWFPELRKKEYSMGAAYDGHSIAADYPYNDHSFNHFMPWMMNQDGSEEETLNHVGRHELGGSYTDGNYRSDPSLTYQSQGQFNGSSFFLYGSGGMFHLREDPLTPGRYYGVRSPEFGSATSGDLVRVDGPQGANTEQMKLEAVALKDSNNTYRNPLPLSDGELVAVHNPTNADLTNTGTTASPSYNYAFRMRLMTPQDSQWTPGAYLTGGIVESVQYWSPDTRVSWSGTLWELDPVEVRSRTAPIKTAMPALETPELNALASVGVIESDLRKWLKNRNLAMVVSRNVTTRDRADRQQPYNLQVAGGGAMTLGAVSGPLYSLTHLQLYQADQLRGYAYPLPPQSGGTISPGRRVLAVPMHESIALQSMGKATDTTVPGSVKIAADGSMAAFVPAGRAMTWQLMDNTQTSWSKVSVRERNWVSFRPGELRVCTSCHAPNTQDQAGNAEPQNTPQALSALLTAWKKVKGGIPVP